MCVTHVATDKYIVDYMHENYMKDRDNIQIHRICNTVQYH